MKKDKAEDTMHILLAVILYVLFPAVSNPRAFPTQVAVSATPESRSEPKVFAPGIISSAVILSQFRRAQAETALPEMRLNMVDQRVAFVS